MPKNLDIKDPKGQIEFLDKVLDEKIKQSLVEELNYRTLTSLAMYGHNKGQQQILTAQTSAKNRIEAVKEEIRHIKALMLDIGNGNYQV